MSNSVTNPTPGIKTTESCLLGQHSHVFLWAPGAYKAHIISLFGEHFFEHLLHGQPPILRQVYRTQRCMTASRSPEEEQAAPAVTDGDLAQETKGDPASVCQF